MEFSSIRSGSENTFIESLLNTSSLLGSFSTAGGNVIWLNYTNASGSWIWGDGYSGSYTNWAPGKPDESGACAYLDVTGSGGTWPLASWDDTPCSSGGSRVILCADR